MLKDNFIFKKPFAWFFATGILVTLLSITYVSMHKTISEHGSMIVKLDVSSVNDLNRIIFSDASNQIQTDTTISNDSMRKQMAFTYLELKFNMANKAKWQDTKTMLMTLPLKNFADYLVGSTFEITSFFWLGSRYVYWEIIFWSWFGLLASLFYNVSEAIRLANSDESHKGFSMKELPVHIAKFFYTPFSAIIIFMSLDVLSSSGEVSVSQYGYGTIVLSFILGFFSGRTIELLNRIKEVVLPGGKKEEPEAAPKDSNEIFKIKGTVTIGEGVTMPDNKPISAVNISLADDTNKINRSATVDDSGSFIIDKLAPGNYIIAATVDVSDESQQHVGGVANVIIEDGNEREKIISIELKNL